jgi:hypothetical protein
MKVIYVKDNKDLAPLDGAEIRLGRSGRGRTEVIIPIDPGIDRGSIGDPRRADAGDLPRASAAVTADGGVRLIPEAAPSDRVLLVLTGDPGYYRGADYSYDLPTGSRVLARGRGAYGDAGRLGGWDEILAVAPASGEIRLTAKYSTHVLRWDDAGVRILSAAEAKAEAATAADPVEII